MTISNSRFSFASGIGRASRRVRGRFAFTLIELLMVITIIGLLAALIVWGTSRASQIKVIKRVEGELAGITLAIDSFHKKHGFYPAGNATPISGNIVNTGTNQLLYELTGVGANKAGGTFTNVFGETISTAEVKSTFGVDGFVNAGATRDEFPNFLTGLKPDGHATIPGTSVRVLVVPAKGTGGEFNPWHYNSTSPEHNPESYDLWADVVIGGKTVRIGNWKE